MSCSSCGISSNSCSCTTYQLPVGPTGAAGATGATGSQGPEGTNLIANIAVGQSTSTTGSYETLYTYTLSNPSPISASGDILIIRSFWSSNDGAPAFGSAKTVKVLIDSTDIVVYGITATATFTTGIFGIVHEVELSRISATTVSPHYLAKRYGAFGIIGMGQELHSPNINSAGSLTIPSLDSGARTVVFKANSIVSGDLTLDRIQLLKITS